MEVMNQQYGQEQEQVQQTEERGKMSPDRFHETEEQQHGVSASNHEAESYTSSQSNPDESGEMQAEDTIGNSRKSKRKSNDPELERALIFKQRFHELLEFKKKKRTCQRTSKIRTKSKARPLG